MSTAMFSENPTKRTVRGRPHRGVSIGTKITEEEFTQVVSSAESTKKSVAEWLRDVALKAARNTQPDPIFIEIIYCRDVLASLVQMVALKTGVAQDAIAKQAVVLKEGKLQRAIKDMEPYTQPTSTK